MPLHSKSLWLKDNGDPVIKHTVSALNREGPLVAICPSWGISDPCINWEDLWKEVEKFFFLVNEDLMNLLRDFNVPSIA